jgi:hypothetical protein
VAEVSEVPLVSEVPPVGLDVLLVATVSLADELSVSSLAPPEQARLSAAASDQSEARSGR